MPGAEGSSDYRDKGEIMPEIPEAKVKYIQEQIKVLGEDLRNFADTLKQQHAILQRLQSSRLGRKFLGGKERDIQELMAYTTMTAGLSQRLEQFLPLFEESLSGLEKDLTAREKEHEQLRAVFDVSQAINSTLNLSEVLNRVMDNIIALTGAERGFLMLSDEETGEMVFKVARNMDRETIEGSSFEISRSIVKEVETSGQAVLTTNAQADPRFSAQESVVSYSLRSILCVPLRARDKVTGVIYTDNRIKTGLFTEEHRDLLVALANQAAVAIENARLFERVKRNLEEITEMKNLMDNIFASIASGVITTDVMDKITLFNRAAESILGVPAHRAQGLPYHEVLGFLDATPIPSFMEAIKTRERKLVAYEVEPQVPNRGKVNLSLSLSTLKDAQDETVGVAIVVDDLTEKRRLREMFQSYVAPSVVERLLSDTGQWKLGGNRQELTIFFADIRGFTSFSEKLDPEKLVVILNEYLALAASAVLQHEGTLDKFMGDAVMAIFNAPMSQPDHALRAVKAALDMRRAIAEHHQKTEGPQLHFGVGINTGEAVAGNIGTEQPVRQMNFTAIGDAVNYAKRLQESAGGGQIILSESTYQQVKDLVEVMPLEPMQVKGRSALEQVYELIGLKG